MRSKIIVILLFVFINRLSALADSNEYDRINIGVDVQTKYVWRGMEMMTVDAAPVLFPQINYQKDGLYAYVMGGYSTNGKYAEVDLGVSYSLGWLTFGINDYYYPTVNTGVDNYFSFSSHNTNHWLEGAITITPDKMPLSLVISNFFAGADKKANGKQAYSSYIELGTWYDFSDLDKLSFNLGVALNKSCYNNYEHGIGVCNIEMKMTHIVNFGGKWLLPISASYIINPNMEKTFVNLSLSLSF